MSINTCRVLILDFDDTLVATYRVRSHTLARTALKFGAHIDPQTVRTYWGKPFHQLIEALVPDVPVNVFLERYKLDMECDEPIALPGAEELLNYAKQTSKKVLIHSSSDESLILQDISRLGWSRLVDGVFGSNSSVYFKPDPRSLAAAFEWINSSLAKWVLADVVYIGDSPNDARVAYSWGIEFIGVLTGHATDRLEFGAGTRLIEGLDVLIAEYDLL